MMRKQDKLKGQEDALFKKLCQLDPVKNQLYQTEIGVAQIFSELFCDHLRFNATVKRWWFYDGVRWCEDVGGAYSAEQAKTLYRLMIRFGSKIENEELLEKYFNAVRKYGAFRKRQTLLDDAKSLMTVQQTDFDRNPNLLNLQNGTLDLKTLEFGLHNPADFISKVCGCDYKENAVSERWEQFISEVLCGDNDKIRYLQRLAGYWLTAETGLECGFFLYGATTRNGKDTFLGTIGAMLGDYAGTLNPESLTVNKWRSGAAASPDIAALFGKRFVNVSEPEQRMTLDAALYKRLTGGTEINARRLYAEPFNFKPQFKLCFNCNHLPTVLDNTIFQSNRTRIITFDRHFQPQEQDRQLKQKLRQPEVLTAVLQWALVGLVDFRQNGERPPDCVSVATTAYRQKNDKLLRFWEDCLEKSDTNSKAVDVYNRYKNWCASNNLFIDCKTTFLNILREQKLLSDSGTIKGKTVKNVILNYSLK